MKRALGVSEGEGSRTRANPGDNSASSSGEVQDGQGPQARERQDRAELLPVLAEIVPARTPLVKFQPALRERKPEDFNRLGLTPDLWGVILKLLDYADLSSVMQSCRGLYHYGDDANAVGPPGPQSTVAWKQRKTSRKCLDAELQNYRAECDRLRRHADPRHHAQAYAQTLHDLASRLHTVELAVWRGFEDGIVQALSMATRWQSAHLHIGQLADAGCVRRLESALQAQRRICRIELHIDEPLDCAEFLPSGAGLILEGLHLTGLEYDSMEPFRALLEDKESRLHTLSLSGNETPDAILPWLTTGCGQLVKLHIDDGPRDPQLLLKLLQAKALTEFGLGNTGFEADGLTLKDLLSALPKLQVLRLNAVSFGPDSDDECTEVFERCALRELNIMACLLEEPDDKGDQESIAAAHQDFCLGLSKAPQLEVLNIHAPVEMHGKGSSMKVILCAFLSNPAAKVVYCLASDLDSLRSHVDKANQVRARGQLSAVKLEVKSDIPGFPEQTRWAQGLNRGPAPPSTAGDADSGEDAESAGSDSE